MTRKIIDFIKSPTGKFIIFFLAVITFALVFRYIKSLPDKKVKEPQTFNDSIYIERQYERFREQYQNLKGANNTPIKSKEEHELDKQKKVNEDLEKQVVDLERALAEEKAGKVLNQVHLIPKKAPENSNRIILSSSYISYSPVSLFSSKNKPKLQDEKILSQDYAPYGRLIKCQLVNTVDSSSFDTPIIALVTENLWHDGRIIIPAGTEVHGRAASLTQRNRIAAEKEWILVWRTRSGDNGLELPLQATALDHDKDSQSGQFRITDGSAGLRGAVIETDEYAKLRLYAALFIKGAADGLSELILEEARSSSENTFINSSQPEQKSENSQKNQLKVGVAKGFSEAIDLYAKNMLDSISRDGVFVRVPAGRSFYLYVTQTIDKSKASVGSLNRSTETSTNESPESKLEEAQEILLSVAKQRLLKEESSKKSREEK